jgi:hypothetical protein
MEEEDDGFYCGMPGVVVAARRGKCAVVTMASSSDSEDRYGGGHGQG